MAAGGGRSPGVVHRPAGPHSVPVRPLRRPGKKSEPRSGHSPTAEAKGTKGMSREFSSGDVVGKISFEINIRPASSISFTQNGDSFVTHSLFLFV